MTSNQQSPYRETDANFCNQQELGVGQCNDRQSTDAGRQMTSNQQSSYRETEANLCNQQGLGVGQSNDRQSTVAGRQRTSNQQGPYRETDANLCNQQELGVGQSNDRQSTDAMIIHEETREAQQQLHLTEPGNSVIGEGQTGNMSRPVNPVPDVLNLTSMENHRVRSDEPCLSSDMTASSSNTSIQTSTNMTVPDAERRHTGIDKSFLLNGRISQKTAERSC